MFAQCSPERSAIPPRRERPGFSPFSQALLKFDDTDWQAARSGRLYVVRFPEWIDLPVAHERSRPGRLGMPLYAYRVNDLAAYCDHIQASAAQNVTERGLDEFGDRSFSFTAPDDDFWTLIEQQD